MVAPWRVFNSAAILILVTRVNSKYFSAYGKSLTENSRGVPQLVMVSEFYV